MNITTALESLIDLGVKNQKLLEAINSAFYTKKDHLSTNLDGNEYVIPSFLSLENKINHLQDSFNNLVQSPKYGEAWYQMDGNSRSIEIRNYQSAPSPIEFLSLDTNEYGVDTSHTNPFMDLLSPQPYYKLDVRQLPNDINSVLIKKVVIYSEELQIETSKITDIKHHEYLRILDKYAPGKDYSIQEKLYQIPIRKSTSSGLYTIKEILEDYINEDMEQIIILTINEDPIYRISDGTTSKTIQIGDQLTTFDGSCKMEVSGIMGQRLTLKIRSYEYSNFHIDPTGSGKIDYAKLRYFEPVNFQEDKYLQIPLEEDPHIVLFPAPYNSRMNIVSQYGVGKYLNVLDLTHKEFGKFSDYYYNNVKNYGDILHQITFLSGTPITSLPSGLYEQLIHLTPQEPLYQVSQYNLHMNSGEGERKIQQLYANRKSQESEIGVNNAIISQYQKEISSLSYGNEYEQIQVLEENIRLLEQKNNEIRSNVHKINLQIQQISNDNNIGGGKSKFRVRGYVPLPTVSPEYVIGIEVYYRYKHPESPTNNTLSLPGTNYLATEWGLYQPPLKESTLKYSNGNFEVIFKNLDLSSNDIKYNQIELPISQGEKMDFKVRYVYSFGYPFTRTYSQWSEIYVVDFPDSLKINVQILDILKEVGEDLKKSELNTLLDNNGTLTHISDQLTDQDRKYYHRAENISSGFYNEDQRVISLKDKIQQMEDSLRELKGSITESQDQLEVSFIVNGQRQKLDQYMTNIIGLPSISSLDKSSGDIYIKKKGEKIITNMVNFGSDGENIMPRNVVFIKGFLSFKNTGNTKLRLYKLFYGDGYLYEDYAKTKNYQNSLGLFLHYPDKTRSLDYDNVSWVDHPRNQALDHYNFNNLVQMGLGGNFKTIPQHSNQFLMYNLFEPHYQRTQTDMDRIIYNNIDQGTILRTEKLNTNFHSRYRVNKPSYLTSDSPNGYFPGTKNDEAFSSDPSHYKYDELYFSITAAYRDLYTYLVQNTFSGSYKWKGTHFSGEPVTYIPAQHGTLKNTGMEVFMRPGISGNYDEIFPKGPFTYLHVYPITFSEDNCEEHKIDPGYNFKLINPGQEVLVPIGISYSIDDNSGLKEQNFGFTIKPSLYSDPHFYKINFRASFHDNVMVQGKESRVYRPNIK